MIFEYLLGKFLFEQKQEKPPEDKKREVAAIEVNAYIGVIMARETDKWLKKIQSGEASTKDVPTLIDLAGIIAEELKAEFGDHFNSNTTEKEINVKEYLENLGEVP